MGGVGELGAVAPSPGGCANLFQAVMRSDTAALEELLAGSRASAINQPNAAGLTPLMLAIERDRPVSRRYLEEHGAAHLYARFDQELVRRVAARPAVPMAPEVRLQLLELELRHPEQRQASLRRLLSYSSGTVEDVSRMVNRHREAADGEQPNEGAEEAVRGLRCHAPKGGRLRLHGTGVPEGLHMIDTQELLDELVALADPQACGPTVQAGGTDATKHDHMASRRASVCRYGDSCWVRLAEPEPEPEVELLFEAGWFPESEEEPGLEEHASVRASRVAYSDSPTVVSSSSGEEEEEQDHVEREQRVRSNKSTPELRTTAPKTKTTASGKMKNYSNVRSRVDARLRRSKSDSSARQCLHEFQQSSHLRPRVTLSFGEALSTAEASWHPSAALFDDQADPTPGKDHQRYNPNVSAAALEWARERRIRPSSADSIAIMSMVRTASDLNSQRRTVTTPPTSTGRTVSPVTSVPNSPTTSAQAIGEIIGESALRDKKSLSSWTTQQQQQQQQQQPETLGYTQRRMRYEELMAESFLTELCLKQRRAEREQQHSSLMSGPPSSALQPLRQEPGAMPSSAIQSSHDGPGAGTMMPLAQRTHHTQNTQEHIIREQQLDNHRRTQRKKTLAAALPKKSRRTAQAIHGAHQKQTFRPAQTWSGTMLAW